MAEKNSCGLQNKYHLSGVQAKHCYAIKKVFGYNFFFNLNIYIYISSLQMTGTGPGQHSLEFEK